MVNSRGEMMKTIELNKEKINQYQKVRKLLLDNGSEIDANDFDGMTAFMWASIYSRKETAELLLDHGADINSKEINGKTALMWAAIYGNLKAVEWLLENGADISIKCDDNYTALLHAFKNDQIDAVNLILKFAFNNDFPRKLIDLYEIIYSKFVEFTL